MAIKRASTHVDWDSHSSYEQLEEVAAPLKKLDASEKDRGTVRGKV